MYIKKVELRGFRNYKKATIIFARRLCYGANDVGNQILYVHYEFF
jgi:recombinational DNA repair ATPase RecF